MLDEQKRIRIAIIQGAFLPSPPLLGGAVEKVWHALGREFAVNGHDVVHISRQYDGLEETNAEKWCATFASFMATNNRGASFC